MNSIRILKDEEYQILTDNETSLELEHKTTKVKLKINKDDIIAQEIKRDFPN